MTIKWIFRIVFIVSIVSAYLICSNEDRTHVDMYMSILVSCYLSISVVLAVVAKEITVGHVIIGRLNNSNQYWAFVGAAAVAALYFLIRFVSQVV